VPATSHSRSPESGSSVVDTRRAFIIRWFPQVTQILGWTAVDKCILLSIVILAFSILYGLLEYIPIHHPDLTPSYIAPAFLETAFWVQVTMIGIWSVYLIVAVALRRSHPESRTMVYAFGQLYAIEISYGSYVLGIHTSVFTGVVAVALAAVGFTFFDRRPIVASLATFFLATTSLTLAEQAGLIPYAPVLDEAPFAQGHLVTSWLVNVGGVTLIVLLFVIALVDFVIDTWHDRDEKLARATKQLAQANEIISRYVASQLAAEIRAGRYESIDRHDRRRLTMFFSDIKDFAATADVVEPEDLSQVLNEYLSEMTAIGSRYGATIDKFVGDAIVIFFGAPMATSDRDHALRAVRMAVEMQTRMRSMGKRWRAAGFERPFQIRIGINTGQASVGNFGSRDRMDYTAIGRQVNLAARLQTHCEPGRILLSHSTWSLVSEEIACVPKGEIEVKGFRSPVKVYEVVLGEGDVEDDLARAL
jgi:adenylate cyclase